MQAWRRPCHNLNALSHDSTHNFEARIAHVALLAVRIVIFPLLDLFKEGVSLESRAYFASSAPSATTTACIAPANLWISYAIYCLLCIFTASCTLVFSKLHIFCKECSPPSVGSTISKAAAMQNHEISTFSGPPITWISTIFAPLTAPRFALKTIASAERADKRPLPTRASWWKAVTYGS